MPKKFVPTIKIKKGFVHDPKTGSYVKTASAPKKDTASSAMKEPDNERKTGIFGQLMKHKDQGERGAGTIEFDDGHKVKISPEHRDIALRMINSKIGAGKSPDERDKFIKSLGSSHKNFVSHITGTYKPEPKHPMSAAREEKEPEKETVPFDAPYKTVKRGPGGPSSEAKWLAKREAQKQMKKEDTAMDKGIIEKLRLAVEEGILSENDFALLTNEEAETIDEKTLSPKQKKIAKIAGDPKKIDAEDLAALRAGKTSEEVDHSVQEASDKSPRITVDKKKHKWGQMITVHRGSETSYPLHPEHQEKIKNLKDDEETTFKDETGRKVTARRSGDMVHLSGPGSNRTTSVALTHFTEESTQMKTPKEEVTIATAQTRFFALEGAIRDVLSKNLELRKDAREKKFK